MRRRDFLAGSAAFAGLASAQGAAALTLPQELTSLGSAGVPSWVLPGAKVDLNFATSQYYGGTLASLIANSNSTGGYVTDSSGALHLIAANTPRIASGTGLLVEQTSTNIIPQSNGFTSWTANSATITQNQLNDRSGAATMTLFNEGTGTAGHYSVPPNGTFTAATYTTAVDISPGTARYVAVRGLNNSTWPWVTLDTQLGVLTANSAVTSSGFTSWVIGGITYYRVWLTYTATATASGPIVATQNTGTPLAVTTPVPASFTGVNGTFYYGLLQTENLAFPTSYIPTTTVAVARSADNVTATGALATAMLGSTASYVVVTNAMQNQANFGRIIGTTSVGTQDPILLNSTTSQLFSNISASLGFVLGTGTTLGLTKIGFAFDATGRSVVANNGTVAKDTNVPSLVAPIYLGRNAGTGSGSFGDGYIPRLSVFNSRLPDTTLKALTQ